MAIDSAKAFEISANGVSFADENGDQIFYLTTGTGDPTGSSAPQNTWYFRQDTQTLYYKFGAGNNDWRQIRADDITSSAAAGTPPGATVEARLNAIEAQFVPTPNVTAGTPPGASVEERLNAIAAAFTPFNPANAENITATDLQALGEALANRHFGKDATDQTKVASETVTGSAFTAYDTLNFNVSAESTPNRYRLSAEFLWGHNSASNDVRVQLVLDGSPFEEVRVEPKDAGGDQRIPDTITEYGIDLAPGAHTLTLQYRPATASRVSRMFKSTLEVWRTQ